MLCHVSAVQLAGNAGLGLGVCGFHQGSVLGSVVLTWACCWGLWFSPGLGVGICGFHLGLVLGSVAITCPPFVGVEVNPAGFC